MKIRQIVTFVLVLGAVKGQSVSPGVSFEVAVIRPAAPPTPDTMRAGQFRVGTQINKGGAEFNFVTLDDLIPYAYRLKPFQIAGAASTKDILKERWNIQTRFPESNANQVPEMMQALLAERFKLTIHHESREQPVYELVVAKGGPKLGTPGPVDDAANDAASATPGLPGFFPPFGGPGRDGGRGPGGPGAPGPNGSGGGGRGFAITSGNATITPSPNTCGIHMEFTKLTMASLAETLTPFLDGPVVDATKLGGAYSVALNLPMEVMFGMIQNMARSAGFAAGPGGGFGPGGFGGRGGPGGDGPGGGRGGPGGCDPGALGGDDSNSSTALFDAVKQLGLRLEPRKTPFDTIVVDHLEKTPTDN